MEEEDEFENFLKEAKAQDRKEMGILKVIAILKLNRRFETKKRTQGCRRFKR